MRPSTARGLQMFWVGTASVEKRQQVFVGWLDQFNPGTFLTIRSLAAIVKR
ncbi:MAG: hypothetical protein JOZ62_17330 [Acidobacteriaceae bacterium]|nr:hypothetical protein [Acidobacteriaceae bacterium]